MWYDCKKHLKVTSQKGRRRWEYILVLVDSDELQWLSWPWLLNSRVPSTDHVRWTMSDEKHGNRGESTIHEDLALHFSDSVTTMCKALWILVSHIVPRAPSNWQPIAYVDPGVPNIEAKLLAHEGILVVLLPLNKGICHFLWWVQDCNISVNHSSCESLSNTARVISASATVVVGGCQSQCQG